jgi:hypothetical protein
VTAHWCVAAFSVAAFSAAALVMAPAVAMQDEVRPVYRDLLSGARSLAAVDATCGAATVGFDVLDRDASGPGPP